jgi:aminoglycoside phosphotransferase (APT) family kinase protein
MSPAPKIEHFSLTLDDVIESPFSIQARIPGRSVGEVYSTLNTAQRIAFAADLGRALVELSRISTLCPGTFDPDSVLHGSSTTLKVLRLQCPPRNAQH